MSRSPARILLFAAAATPFIVAFAQAPQPVGKEPTCEQVFKNIQVFKGVPASDLIPSMEFMAASLKYECADCHDPKDYAAETRVKDTARHMVLMQRDINGKNFNNRNQVTCMTCHGGKEHPTGTPVPLGISLRHPKLDSAPKAEELFAKHISSAGTPTAALVRSGTLTAPNDATHKPESTPLQFIQGAGGKFSIVAGERTIQSNGTATWYGGQEMGGEPGAIFGRVGRAWRGPDAFAGLERPMVVGQDRIGKTPVIVVRGTRAATEGTEELYFEPKTNLLVRLVNIRRSTLGSVVSVFDYSNYRSVGGAKVPMKVVMTFAGGEQWVMDFRSARVDQGVPDTTYAPEVPTKKDL